MSELIEKIKNHEILKGYIVLKCRQGASEVRISDQIGDYCIVNPEAYFLSQHSGDTPSSVDFIITTQCKNSTHFNNLVELKSISSTLRGEDSNIYKKFEDTLDKFIIEKFSGVYLSEDKPYFKLFLVHNIKKSSEIQYLAKLFFSPVKRMNRNFYISPQNSPYELQRC